MKLLACATYDPAVAVSKATTAALALTALDTTNLRLNFTIPAHGMVYVRMKGQVHGATTAPQIMLGVLEGSTKRGRCAAKLHSANIAATTIIGCEAQFTVSGLTPGTVNWDAAYGVETVVAATGLKYGGPNDTTANNNFGAFCFEIWDPAPAAGAGGGATAQEVWEYATRVLTAGTNIALAKGTGVTGFNDIAAGAVRTELATELGRIDAAVSTRLATAGYTAPDNAGIVAVKAKTDNLPVDPADQSLVIAATDAIRSDIAAIPAAPSAASIRSEIDTNSTKLDVSVGTRMATFTYTAPDNAGIAAVKAVTDKFLFTQTSYLKVDALYLNGVQVVGAGTTGNRWRGAT